MEAETFLSGKVTLHCGDCIEVLKQYPDNHFDSLVSDPPYGLEFMGKEWDGADGFRRSLNKADAERDSVMGRMSRKAPEYKAGHLFQEWCEAWARETLRVLKPGGFIVCFGGTRTFHRLVSAIEDAGFEVRDMIAWLYGSGFPKSLNISKAIDKEAGAERTKVRHEARPVSSGTFAASSDNRPWITESQKVGYHEVDSDVPASAEAEKWQGWGTALKPAIEPICLARKPLEADTVAGNVLLHGTGGINVNGCRVETEDSLNGGAYSGGAKDLSAATSYATGVNAGEFVQPEGRWPANVVHDGSYDVKILFPDTQSGALNRANITASNKLYGAAPKVRSGEYEADSGSAARFFYEVKPDVDPICLARKPLSEDTVAENILKHGTGGLNVDGCRVESSAADQEYMKAQVGGFKNTKSIGGKASGILGGGNVTDRSEFDPSKGRWPANVLHDGSQEVVETFPETAPGSAAVRNNGAFKSVAKGNELAHSTGGHDDEGGSAARYFYAVKPDLDPICLARKPLAEDTVAENVVKHGTGGLNIDGCRVGDEDRVNPSASHNDIYGQFKGKETEGRVTSGRWPANVVTDGSQEVLEAFPAESSVTGKRSERSKAAEVEGTQWLTSNHKSKEYVDSGSVARFFYTAKAGNDDRLGSSHPTIKPIDLMQWLVRLVTPPGGLVLEPFAGSGTTGEAAFREGMRAVLIELDPVSCEDIRRRMALVLAGPKARKVATVKAKIKAGRVKVDDGPLFTMTAKIEQTLGGQAQ